MTMTETEEYFPRGKVAPAVAKAAKANNDLEEAKEKRLKRKAQSKLDNLFSDYDSAKKEKKKGKKSKNALTPQEVKALGKKRSSDEKRFAVVPLSRDQIVEGMLCLGMVLKVTDHEIFVSLPGRIVGVVSITNISSPYVELIEKFMKGKGNNNDEVVLYTLKEMFYVGQTVLVKVQSIENGEKPKISLSMNPKDIYANYNTTILKKDLVMVAAVVSEEDHGYVMDVGINGARCFLSRDDADKFIKGGNFNRKLGIGQLVYCMINNITVHRLIADIKLTAFRKVVRSKKVDDMMGLNYSTLVPGMLIDVIVMQTHRTGFMAHCLEFNALVHQDHLNDEWASPESLEIGSTVTARVLYTLPNLTSPYLTLQTDLVPLSYNGDRTNREKLGSKEQVRVVRVSKRGIVVRIEEGGYKGFVPISHLGDQSLLTTEDISKKFKDKSLHEARILKYSPLERMYICSFKRDLLDGDIVHLEKVVGGKKVNCQILQWNKGGAMVTFGTGMRGFIPNSLFRAEKLSDAAKEKLAGTTHKARIFSRDMEKERVLLTVRKEFVQSKGVVICGIGDAQVGMIGHAVIKSFNTVGVYVETLGGCEGFIPASKLSYQKLDNFKEVFHFGQIVEYKVIDINLEKNHLVLTLKLDADPEDQNKARVKKGKKRKHNDSVTESVTGSEGEDSSGIKKKRRRRRRKSKNAEKDTSVKTEEDTGHESSDAASEDESEGHDLEKTGATEVDNGGLELPGNLSFWDTTTNTATGDKDESDDDEQETVTKTKKKKGSLKVSLPLNLVSANPEPAEGQPTLNLELVEKYERGEISNPNDPKFWTTLMTHYSSLGIVDKARAVGKQALEMISYREEKAKLNVWGALLKLEIKYGTEDTLKSALADALQRNDQFECLKMIALVYDNADRFKDAEKTYRQIVKQYRLEPDAWIRFGNFYYLREKFDSGRALLNEALSTLPFNLHVNVITKFALFEIHHGEKSRGESMFDHVLVQHPQRVDLWLMYVNALIKATEFEQVRAVFTRAFDIKWNPKKVKPLLKRYLEFETAHGTDETRAEFQNLAMKVLNFSESD